MPRMFSYSQIRECVYAFMSRSVLKDRTNGNTDYIQRVEQAHNETRSQLRAHEERVEKGWEEAKVHR